MNKPSRKRKPRLQAKNAANWLHLERLRPIDDGTAIDGEFIIPLGDLAAFDLMSVPEEEHEALLNYPIIHGFDPATLERNLKRGHF